jgi:hypothetical protein
MFSGGLSSKKRDIIIMVFLWTIFSGNLSSETRRIPPDTVFAEYRGGIITRLDFDRELSRLPSLVRARYSSITGRQQFLEAIVINRITYLKALELGIDREPQTFYEYRDDLKPYYAGLFRSQKITGRVDLPESDPQESKTDIVIRNREREQKKKVLTDLKEKYSVEVDYDLFLSLNLFHLTPQDPILKETVISSEISELNVTVAELYRHFLTLSPYITTDDLTSGFEFYHHLRFLPHDEWRELSSQETLERLINNVLEVNLFAHEAREMGFERYHAEDLRREPVILEQEESLFDAAVFNNPEVQQLRRFIILKAFFEQEVIEVADPTPEDIREYYQNNLDEYTVPEMRQLQFFLYDTEREAAEMRVKAQRALEENDELTIIDLIRQSPYPQILRAMQTVSRTNPLPHFENDQALYDLVWNSLPGEISAVHRSRDGLYYFLVVSEHIPAYQYHLGQYESEISDLLTFKKRNNRWQDVVAKIMKEYQVTLYPERMLIILTAEELFSLAEQAQSDRRYHEAIAYYDRIIEQHRNSVDDYRALFAKAFLMTQNLNLKKEGAEFFRELLNNYPEAELHESARYLLQILSEEG